MTEKELRYHTLYMDIADRVSCMSHAVRAKVGALLVRENNILAFGFNGTPAGQENCCETQTPDGLETKPNVLHAEQNMFFKCMKDGIKTKSSSLYITLAPCLNCSKLIYGAGVSEVFYDHAYRDLSGVDFLISMGVKVEKL